MQQLKLYCRVIFCISIVVTHNSFADDQLIKIYNYISHDLLLSYNLKVYISLVKLIFVHITGNIKKYYTDFSGLM